MRNKCCSNLINKTNKALDLQSLFFKGYQISIQELKKKANEMYSLAYEAKDLFQDQLAEKYFFEAELLDSQITHFTKRS